MNDKIVEIGARAICAENDDCAFDQLPKNKAAWLKAQGMFGGRFRDVNEPRQDDYLDMMSAAIAALEAAGYSVVSKRFADAAEQAAIGYGDDR